MKKKPTSEDAAYKAQSLMRIAMLQQMLSNTVHDMARVRLVLDELRERFRKIDIEIKQEESQWKEGK